MHCLGVLVKCIVIDSPHARPCAKGEGWSWAGLVLGLGVVNKSVSEPAGVTPNPSGPLATRDRRPFIFNFNGSGLCQRRACSSGAKIGKRFRTSGISVHI